VELGRFVIAVRSFEPSIFLYSLEEVSSCNGSRSRSCFSYLVRRTFSFGLDPAVVQCRRSTLPAVQILRPVVPSPMNYSFAVLDDVLFCPFGSVEVQALP